MRKIGIPYQLLVKLYPGKRILIFIKWDLIQNQDLLASDKFCFNCV